MLIEIRPINNVRVLKAVDSCVRVQVNFPTKREIFLMHSARDKKRLSAEIAHVILQVLQRQSVHVSSWNEPSEKLYKMFDVACFQHSLFLFNPSKLAVIVVCDCQSVVVTIFSN